MTNLDHVAGLFRPMVLGWTAVAIVTATALLFISAPYGRYARRGWGPPIDARLSWAVMESPAALGVPVVWWLLGHADTLSIVLLTLWESHYLYRAFVYPLRLRASASMPVGVTGMAFFFNLVNASVQGLGIFVLPPACSPAWLCAAWLHDPRFIFGTVVFLGGMIVNHQADARLRALRAPGESAYKVPHGGLFEVISCPNYFGEIVQWLGWAMLTWSLAGLSFAVWSAANLAPRALAHHRWYRATFPAYPAERKALIPYLL